MLADAWGLADTIVAGAAALLLVSGLLCEPAWPVAGGTWRRVPRSLACGLLPAALAAAIPPIGPVAWGLLVGGVALAMLDLARRPSTAVALAALVGVGCAMAPFDVAVGLAVGVAAAVGLSLQLEALLAREPDPAPWLPARAALFLVAAATAFGITREESRADLLPAAFALAAGVAWVGLAPLARRLGGGFAPAVALLAGGLALTAGRLLAAEHPVAPSFVLGLVTGLLLGELEPEADGSARQRDGLIAAAMVAACAALAFTTSRALGLAAAGLGCAAALLSRPDRAGRAAPSLALAALIGWVMLRLAFEHGVGGERLDLFRQTPLNALIAGLLLPWIPLALPSLRGRPAAIIGLGATVLGTVVIVALWGAAAALGVVAAGVLGAVLTLALAPLLAALPDGRARLELLAAGWVAVPTVALPVLVAGGALTDRSRWVKLGLLVLGGVFLAVALTVARRREAEAAS